MSDDSGAGSSRERLARLWSDVRPDENWEHAIDAAQLGEYAALEYRGGIAAAARAFPLVARHLADECEACLGDLRELRALVREVLAGGAPGARTAAIDYGTGHERAGRDLSPNGGQEPEP